MDGLESSKRACIWRRRSGRKEARSLGAHARSRQEEEVGSSEGAGVNPCDHHQATGSSHMGKTRFAGCRHRPRTARPVMADAGAMPRNGASRRNPFSRRPKIPSARRAACLGITPRRILEVLAAHLHAPVDVRRPADAHQHREARAHSLRNLPRRRRQSRRRRMPTPAA